MPFVGDKGSYKYPAIKRARLIAGEDWLERATLGYTVIPQNTGGLGIELEHKQTWSASGQADLTSTNAYGFTSRSQFLFPEAYKPVDTKFWKPMSAEETADIHRRQALANLKATHPEDANARPLAATEADASYGEASSRRNLSMRRRRKPMNYEERKKEEELRRKLPLTRKYVTGESAFRESSAIVKTGPLDTPVLVEGMLGQEQRSAAASPPAKLKLKRNARRGAEATFDDGQEKNPYVEITLPTFNPNAAPKAKLLGFRNSWGLASRSEMMYPEAYKDMSTVYWRKLSADDQQRITIVQARAMEKAGYERGTEKRFIEEIEPDSGYVYKHPSRMDDTNREGRGYSAEFVITLLVVLAVVAAIAYYGWQSGDEITNNAPQPTTSMPGLEGD